MARTRQKKARAPLWELGPSLSALRAICGAVRCGPLRCGAVGVRPVQGCAACVAPLPAWSRLNPHPFPVEWMPRCAIGGLNANGDPLAAGAGRAGRRLPPPRLGLLANPCRCSPVATDIDSASPAAPSTSLQPPSGYPIAQKELSAQLRVHWAGAGLG